MFRTLSKLSRLPVAIAISAAAFGASAGTTPKTSAAATPPDAQARYQQERAACLDGSSPQDRATCLREAGAALSEARQGNLSDGQGSLRRNRVERCNVLPSDQRIDCIARMRGEGTTEGSVSGGGILREKVTIVPAPTGVASAPATR